MTHTIKPPLTEATAKACVQADERLCAAAVQTFPIRVPRTHKSKTTR